MYVLGLMPSSDPAILQAILSRLPRPYRTSRYAIVDDMVANWPGTSLSPSDIMSVFHCCFLQSPHTVHSCLLKFLRFNYFVLSISVESSNNKNILTTKKVELWQMIDICTYVYAHSSIGIAYTTNCYNIQLPVLYMCVIRRYVARLGYKKSATLLKGTMHMSYHCGYMSYVFHTTGQLAVASQHMHGNSH